MVAVGDKPVLHERVNFQSEDKGLDTHPSCPPLGLQVQDVCQCSW